MRNMPLAKSTTISFSKLIIARSHLIIYGIVKFL